MDGIHKIARLLVTLKCDKNCDGCCNNNIGIDFDARRLDELAQLKKYDKIILTGGEPLQKFEHLMEILKYCKTNFPDKTIYVYSAKYDFTKYKEMLPYVNGLHFTLHYPCTDNEVHDLKNLSHFLEYSSYPITKSLRLAIDKRLYDYYDFSNIDFSPWKAVRKMVWKENCPLPKNEELLFYFQQGV